MPRAKGRRKPRVLQDQRVYLATVTTWVADWGPFITLLSTVLLAAITAWLAYLTKVMADSARTSAEQSRVAAEASLSSVAVAEASLDVQFSVEPVINFTLDELEGLFHELESEGMGRDTELTPDLFRRISTWGEVALTCQGATVNLHGLQLTGVSVQDPTHTDSDAQVGTHTVYDDGVELASTETLPRLCHKGETVRFEVTDRPVGERLAEFSASVSYAVGNGPVRAREVHWTEPPFL